jgi:hypothetical protein
MEAMLVQARQQLCWDCVCHKWAQWMGWSKEGGFCGHMLLVWMWTLGAEVWWDDRDLDSDSEFGEYPWDVGELAKVEGDTDYGDLFKII